MSKRRSLKQIKADRLMEEVYSFFLRTGWPEALITQTQGGWSTGCQSLLGQGHFNQARKWTWNDLGERHNLGRTWNKMQLLAVLNNYQPVVRHELLLFSVPVKKQSQDNGPSVFESKCSGKWIVDEICSMHLLLLCEVLTMVSYLRMESLLVLCAEVTPLGAKVQCHATQRRGAGFIERTWAVQGEKNRIFSTVFGVIVSWICD